MSSEGFVKANRRTWYDVCVKCTRIVSPRHSCCPQCSGTEFKGSIRTENGYEQKPLVLVKEGDKQ